MILGNCTGRQQQLVADSKTKLGLLMERKDLLLELVKNSTLQLQKTVEKCEDDLCKAQEEEQEPKQKNNERDRDRIEQEEIGTGNDVDDHEKQSGQSGRQGSGDRNEKEEIGFDSDEKDDEKPTSEDRLLMLLEIEARLRMLHHSEDCNELLEKFATGVLEWWQEEDLETYQLDSVDYCLRMMWESNDSVWLLGSNMWCDTNVWYTQEVRNILQRIFSTDIRTGWHPQKIVETKQILTTFQQRLKQWQGRTDSLQNQYDQLKIMLECWPEYRKVRARSFRNNEHG